MIDLAEIAWPIDRAAEALAILGNAAGLTETRVALCGDTVNAQPLQDRIEATTEQLGFEAEALDVPLDELPELLARAAPALLQIEFAPDRPGLLVLRAGTSRSTRLIGPDLRERRVSRAALSTALAGPDDSSKLRGLTALLGRTGLSPRQRERAYAALCAERRGRDVVARAWLLRLAPAAPLRRHLAAAGLHRRALSLVAVHLANYLSLLFGWLLIGRAALSGRFDGGWFAGWVLLLLTAIPLRLWTTWIAARLALGGGAVLKQRLLSGALALDPDSVRHAGAGQFLSQVIESNAFESLALGGGFQGVLAVLELAGAAVVLALGADGRLEVALLAGWTAVSLAAGWLFFRRRRRWTLARLEMTHGLVERMVGHRTRLAQEAPADWHIAEDAELESYLRESRRMDGAAAAIEAVLPRGWLALGVLGLAPAFAPAHPQAGVTAALAIGLGGVLLADRALRRLADSLTQLGDAGVAWRRIAPLLRAAAVAPKPAAGAPAGAAPGQPVLQVQDLAYRYTGRAEPVLRGVDLTVSRGDRVLLEGPSGSGKSTLLGLLSGRREPTSGLMLLGGLDRHTLGARAWRHRVVAAPQFHENHVFSASFGFNLLLGRRWPPTAEDVEVGRTVCEELGLGPLLSRMPAGLEQAVGETGWQLSHGERSRLYIARTLLQDADVVVLDESFGALDPETARVCLECVRRRAPALVVVAHP